MRCPLCGGPARTVQIGDRLHVKCYVDPSHFEPLASRCERCKCNLSRPHVPSSEECEAAREERIESRRN